MISSASRGTDEYDPLAGSGRGGLLPMKSADFVVTGRHRLAAIQHFPAVESAEYERRRAEMQETLRRVQQAYLGTSHRAVIVLEGWDAAGKGA